MVLYTRSSAAPLMRTGDNDMTRTAPLLRSNCPSQSSTCGGTLPSHCFITRTSDLSGGCVYPGDCIRLLDASHTFGTRHQHSGLGGLDSSARGNRQCDRSHALVIGHIGNDDQIILAEAIITTDKFAPDGLARRTAHGFNTVLRIFELGSYGFWG